MEQSQLINTGMSSLNILHGSRIAMVSNSDSLLSSYHGQFIDSHDFVIRFNLFSVDPKYMINIGTKTNLYCHNHNVKPPAMIKTPDIRHCFVCCAEGVQYNRRHPVPWCTMTLMYCKLTGPEKHETAGLTMLRWLINNVQFAELNLFGFASGSTSHYYDASHQMSAFHDMSVEAETIKGLASGNIKLYQ